MDARFYIYRNLNRGTSFSVKRRGVVEDMLEFAALQDVLFVIQPAGQRRARRERKRNVHAYVSPTSYNKIKIRPYREKYKTVVDKGREITYNPFKADTFVYKDTNQPVKHIQHGFIANGKLYEITGI